MDIPVTVALILPFCHTLACSNSLKRIGSMLTADVRCTADITVLRADSLMSVQDYHPASPDRSSESMSGLAMNTEETWNADTAPVEKRAHGERPHSHQLHGGAPEEGNPHAHDRHTVRSLKEVS